MYNLLNMGTIQFESYTIKSAEYINISIYLKTERALYYHLIAWHPGPY